MFYILVSSLILLIGGCAGEPAAQHLLDGQARLQAPASWRAEPAASGLLLLRPVEDGEVVPGAFFLVARDAARPGGDASLGSYVALKETHAAAGTQSYQLLARSSVALDGMPAERLLRSWSTRLERRQALAWIGVRNGQGWLLIGSASALDFPRLASDFHEVAESLQWLGADRP